MNLLEKIATRLQKKTTPYTDKFSEGQDERWALIVIGAFCSGKTTIYNDVTYPKAVKLIYEVRPDEMVDIEEKIESALNNNWRVLLELVFCDDPAELVRRMAYRAANAEKDGQFFVVHNIEQMADSFISVPEAAIKLFDKYKNQVECVSIDNSTTIDSMKFNVGRKSPQIVVDIISAQIKHLQSVTPPSR